MANEILTCTYEELDTFLASLDANTVNTAYKLQITDIPDDFVSTIATKLKSRTDIYTDLSPTTLPEITSLENCFEGCSTLVSAPNLPDTVTDMTSCFSGCTSLTSVSYIPDSVTVMERCFYNCKSLTSVPNLPSSVTYMRNCFQGCKSLTSVPNIPDSVTDMSSCFYNCTSLTSVPVIPNSVTDMNGCFQGCTSLREISVFVDSITSYSSVVTDSGITTVYTNNKAKAETIFGTGITYQGLCKYDGLESLLADRDVNTVDNPLKIKIVDIPDNFVSTIATILNTRSDVYLDLSPTTLPEVESLRKCFSNCTTLVIAPYIPDSVTDMFSCFFGCTSLTSVSSLPDSITDIQNCFYGCTALTSIANIPDSITNMGQCFYNCTSLISVPTIPDSVTSMAYCFGLCTSLKSVPNIPDSVTNMSSCFFSCRCLTNAPNIPDSVTNMSYCFQACAGLTSVPNIPASVTDLTECFKNCTSLETIEDWKLFSLDGVTTKDAFKGCTSLKNIYVKKPEPQDSFSLFHIKYTSGNNEFSVIKGGKTTTNIFTGGFNNITINGVVDEFAIGEQGTIPLEIAQQVDSQKLPLSSLDKDFSPDDPHMVIWAKDKDKIKSNLLDEVNRATQSNSESIENLQNRLSAVGNGHIFYRSWTSQQVSDVATLSSLVSEFPVGSLILFTVNWEGNYNGRAGSSGYITIQGESAYAFGCMRHYSKQNYQRAITWIDGLSVAKCSGWVAI